MIITKLQGGLGNQMFQYAAGKCLALKHHTHLYLDISEFELNNLRKFELNCFNVDFSIASKQEISYVQTKNTWSKVLRTIGFLQHNLHWYIEQGLDYNSYWQRLTNDTYIDGYWQTEKYFSNIEDIIRKDFVFKSAPSEINQSFIDKVITHNSVAVHIRRGDYVNNKITNSYHGVCELDYYIQAMKYIKDRIADAHFYFFSDDLNWVKENLKCEGYMVNYMEHNGNNGIEDLRLMSHCKHFIIANSTYSWWGAWLSNNKNKVVIAPHQWFKAVKKNDDLIPNSWIKM